MEAPANDWSSVVRRGAAGDRAALEQALVRYLPRLRAFVRLRAGPLARAQDDTGDLVQSVCREVLGKADVVRLDDEAGFRHWLFTEAMRKIQKRARYQSADKRDARRTQHADEALAQCYTSFAGPDERAAAREQLELVEAAFDELNERQREVVSLAYVVGLSRAEIAQRLGSTEGAVRVALHRALARIAALLDSEVGRGGC